MKLFSRMKVWPRWGFFTGKRCAGGGGVFGLGDGSGFSICGLLFSADVFVHVVFGEAGGVFDGGWRRRW